MVQYSQQHPWDPGYALPDYVRAEPPGRGTITTMWAPRKTIPELIPDYLGDDLPQLGPNWQQYEKMGAPRSLTTPMEVYDLGLGQSMPLPGFPGDPFKQYGQRISEMLLGTIKEVPIEFRQIALKALLNELEPDLFDVVTMRANKYKTEGMNAKPAVKAALAASLSEGLVRELLRVGQSGKLPAMRTLAGLGMYDEAEAIALEGLWGSIKSAAKSVGGAVKSGAKAVGRGARAVGRGIKTGVRKAGRGIKTGATWVGSKVKAGAAKAYGWGKTALSKIKGLTCTVMKSPVSDMAAGAVAAYYGVPPQVGVAGHKAVTGGLCGKDAAEPIPQQSALTTPGGMVPQKSGMPKWVLPVGIGAAALVGAVLIMKR